SFWRVVVVAVPVDYVDVGLSLKLSGPPVFYPLSLHDALPILRGVGGGDRVRDRCRRGRRARAGPAGGHIRSNGVPARADHVPVRSEEHTSELQSPYDPV